SCLIFQLLLRHLEVALVAPLLEREIGSGEQYENPDELREEHQNPARPGLDDVGKLLQVQHEDLGHVPLDREVRDRPDNQDFDDGFPETEKALGREDALESLERTDSLR